MSFIEKNLSTNEHILYTSKLHWIIYLRGVFLAVLGVLIGSASYSACGFLVFVGMLSLISAFIVDKSSNLL